jgi:NAD(P)H-nitrite reductase large subunit
LQSGGKPELDPEFLKDIEQVDDYLPAEPDKLDDDVLICECFCVSVRDIRLEFEGIGEVSVQQLQDRFSLGQGCQSCLKRIDSWIHKIF